jgi:hypothetical protein
MAINPYQRPMFRPRFGGNSQEDTGGINSLVNMSNPQLSVPVAAQPLQVASLQPSQIKTPVLNELGGKVLEGPYVSSGALAAGEDILYAAHLTDDQIESILDTSRDDAAAGKASTLEATPANAAAGKASTLEATPANANAAKAGATDLAQTLIDADKDPDMAALLKALGPSDINYDNWKEQSKELLGIEEDEADVPDWAAPMFLFGLNLMRGPVSGKVQGQTGLGGLLSDIGAAGEKGFALFATERARKRKEKAQVATLAMQLQSADATRKKLAVEAYKTATAARLNLTTAVGKAYDSSINRVLKLVPDDQKEKQVLAIAAYGQQYRELKNAGVTDRQLLNPATRLLLESYAANEMGITKTPVKLDSMNFGGIDLNFSRSDLESARAEFNKANPQNKIGSMTEFLSKIIAKDPLVQKYQPLVIGQRADNVTSSTLNSVNEDGENITEVRITNEAAREQWFADNPAPPATASQAEKDAYVAKVKAATPTWQITTERLLADSPNYAERSFVNKDGTQTKFYINEAAFDARRRSSPAENKLTLQEVLLNPDKYPKILGGKVKDFSKLQPDLKNILVYDKGLKRTFVLDKNAAGRALAEGKIEPGEGREKLIELGLGRFIGKGVPVKPNEKIQIMKVVNGIPTLTIVEAQDAGQNLAAFTSKADAKDWGTRQTSLITLNTTSFEIDKLLKERGLGVTSSLTDIAGSALTLSKIAGSVFNNATARNSRTAMIASPNTTDETRNLLQQAFRDDVWKNVGENKEQRGAVKSMFINLAFSLASTREGGKLTDNDVKNALETLGWDGSAWTLTPGQVTARLKVATRTANDQYINDALNRISDPAEKEKYLESQDRDEPDFVERLLQERARAVKGVMQARFRADPNAPLRYDRAFPEGQTGGDVGTGGGRRLVPVNQSFKFGVPPNDRGAFSSQVNTARVPNWLMDIHYEVLFPGGEYSPVSSVRDLATRIRSPETAARLKALDLSEQAVTDLVNKYLKYYNDNPDLLVSPQ